MVKRQIDLSDEPIHWDLSKSLSYGQYLDLEGLLNCQRPRSESHDEMLFIVIHQVSELWMKLSLHELTAAVKSIQRDQIRPALKMLSRVSRIQSQLIQGWDVLSTLTPTDYTGFRPVLGTGSGFQSHQYRMIEFILGNKNADMVSVHRHDPAIFDALNNVLNQPSLYDEVLKLLTWHGFDLPATVLDRDWSTPYVPHEAVERVWETIYRDTQGHWPLYELAEKLADVEDWFHQWRFRHMKTVERIIGYKRGTGGTAGVAYLEKALQLRFFPELWTVRTAL